MHRSHLLGIAFACILSLFSSLASAQTPDGLTPAAEDDCDIVKGGTPGLYGLCVAYCDAQDNDLPIDTSDPNNQPTPASSRILEKYRGRMTASDPDMPCLNSPCPCWENNDVNTVGSLGGEPLVCQVTADANLVLEGGINTDTSTGATIYAQTFTFNDRGKGCFWSNGGDIANLSPTSPLIRLDTDDYAACSSQIAARCGQLGLP